jgi:cyclopropane fatty-acyl-phospholipid synthase-like methyltransferase
MDEHNPIDLLFGGMEQLGPGSDEDTRLVLQNLAIHPDSTIVDAGCGTGRQTLVLARELGQRIHAVDRHEPFLIALSRRAEEEKLQAQIETHLLDMQEIPARFPKIDLLWSEGAAYSIGFANALQTWSKAIVPHGLLVVSELMWLKNDPPDFVSEFFRAGYPDMKNLAENVAIAERAGYRLLGTHPLPAKSWTSGYYDLLGPRAQSLLNHTDPMVREFAADTLREMEVFGSSEESYGYVFLILKRCPQ